MVKGEDTNLMQKRLRKRWLAGLLMVIVGALVAALASSTGHTAARAGVMTPAVAETHGDVTYLGKPNVANDEPFPNCLSSTDCYGPSQIRTAYGINALGGGANGAGKTIVVIDAFGSSTLAGPTGDLAFFDGAWGLPGASLNVDVPFGNASATSDPVDVFQWGVETALDVEWAHVIAPAANIELVVAKSDSDQDLFNATKWAIDNRKGDVLTQSFGEAEQCMSPALVTQEHAVFDEAQSKGITVLASAGDTGTALPTCNSDPANPTFLTGVVSIPASDPDVTAIGGTRLVADASGNYESETAWSENGSGGAGAGGGGVSTLFPQQPWEAKTYGGSKRELPDVSYNAAMDGGVIVISTCPAGVCAATPVPDAVFRVGGTSAGSPQWAGLVALADQSAGHDLGQINPTLYYLGQTGQSSYFHDVTTGNTGLIGPGFNAAPGWDEATGWGSPVANALVPQLGLDCDGAINGGNGPLTATAGQTICLAPGANQNGPVTLQPGSRLIANGATIHGPVQATGVSSISVCGSTITGPLSVTGSTGSVQLGGGSSCAGNTVSGPLTLSRDTGGVQVSGNTISGPASITQSSGAGGVVFTANTVSGPLTLTGNAGLVQSGNRVSGPSTIHS